MFKIQTNSENFYNDTCLASGLCHLRRSLQKWADLVQTNWHLINLSRSFSPIFPFRWFFLGWIPPSLWTKVWIHPSRLTQFGIIHAYLQFTKVVNMGKHNKRKQKIQANSGAYRGWIPFQLHPPIDESGLHFGMFLPWSLWSGVIISPIQTVHYYSREIPQNQYTFVYIWSLPNGSQWPVVIVTFSYAFNFPHGISIGKTLVIFLMRLGKIGDDVGLNCSPFNGNGRYIKNHGKQTKTSKTRHVHDFFVVQHHQKAGCFFLFSHLALFLGQIFGFKREVHTLEKGMTKTCFF